MGEISISIVHISAFNPAGFPYFQRGSWDTKWLPGHSMDIHPKILWMEIHPLPDCTLLTKLLAAAVLCMAE
jgi:hypothetical protein